MIGMDAFAVATGSKGIPLDLQQPDGQTIRVTVVGDEFHRTVSYNGYTILQDRKTKEYRYAVQRSDGNVTVSDKVVGKDKPEASLQKGILLPMKKLSKMQQEYVEQRRDKFKKNAASLKSVQSLPGLISTSDGPQLAPPADTTLSAQNGFCLLIAFSDDPDIPAFAPADINTMFNGTTPIWGNAASIKQYYSDQSNGRMTLNTTVSSAYVRLSKTKAYYDDVGNTYGAVEAVQEAIQVLLAQNPNYFDAINLTTYTEGERQVVKAFSVFYPGDPSFGDLWPHSWVLNDGQQTYVSIKPGVYVSNYQISSLLFYSALPVIGVACHEIGHMLCDFSDYYDYGNRGNDNVNIKSYGLGNHCLMSDSDNQQYPAQINPYLRMKAGWIDVQPLPTNLPFITLTPTNFYQHAKSATEYFLFSNVQRSFNSWTQFLPGDGIAIWHIDEEMKGNELEQRTPTQHYECSLEQADGLFHLEQPMPNGNSGDANDYYFLGNPATLYRDEFSDESIPNSLWWDGTSSDLLISHFSINGYEMTMRVIFPGPVITSQNPLPQGRVGNPYWFQFTTEDNYENNVWSVVDPGTLPPGLTLSSSGRLSGLPTMAGTNYFDIVVQGRSILTTTNTFALVILPAYTAPYAEGFNGVMEGSLTGWNQESISNAIPWRTRSGSPSGHPVRPFEGDKNAYLGVYIDSGSASLSNHITRLISPMIQFAPTAREARISFSYYLEERSPVLKDAFKIYYKTAWSNAWSGPVATYDASTLQWVQENVILPESAAGKSIYFAIEGYALGGHGVSLDDIQIDDPVPPLQIITPTPLDPAVCGTNYTLASPFATLESVGGYTNGSGQTSYAYALVGGSLPFGFTLTTNGLIIGQWDSPIALTNFNVEVTDLVSGAKATNTLAFAVEYPRAPILQENFLTVNGSLPSGWTIEYVANRVNWTIGHPGGKDGISPPFAAQSDYQYAFFFGTPSVGTYMVSKLVSPVFDLTQMANNSRLVFWHFMQKWSGQDELRVYYRNVTGAPWTRLEVYTNNVTSWTRRIIQLPSPSRTYQIAFEGSARSGYGVCVDSVSITDDASAPVILTRDTLPSGFDNYSYQTRLEAVGGVTPYTWTVVSNALPRGLTLNSLTGIISGTPVGATQTVFRVAVKGADNKASTNIFYLKILPPGFIPYVENFNETTVPSGWEQTTAIGTATWQVVRGTYNDYEPDYHYPYAPVSETNNLCLWGKLPQYHSAALITSPFDLGGCTNTAVSFNLAMRRYDKDTQDWLTISYDTHQTGNWKTLVAYDSTYFSSSNAVLFTHWTNLVFQLPEPTATYRLKFDGLTRGGCGICIDDLIVVGDRTAPPLLLTTPNPLPDGTNSVVYPDVPLTATGGTILPYTWSIVGSDIFPPGLTLNPTNGVISGTPTQYGLYTFGVTVQDANNVTTTQDYTLRVWSSGLTPYQMWVQSYYNPTNTYPGDGADSGDGIPNLIKYGMDLDPTIQNTGVYILGGQTNLVGVPGLPDGGYLYYTYRRSLTATDLVFSVTGKTNLADVAELWITNNIVELTPWSVGQTGVWSWVHNVHTTPITNAPQRFLRLEVQLK
jgi:M6 family metalloprotease-like protein